MHAEEDKNSFIMKTNFTLPVLCLFSTLVYHQLDKFKSILQDCRENSIFLHYYTYTHAEKKGIHSKVQWRAWFEQVDVESDAPIGRNISWNRMFVCWFLVAPTLLRSYGDFPAFTGALCSIKFKFILRGSTKYQIFRRDVGIGRNE